MRIPVNRATQAVLSPVVAALLVLSGMCSCSRKAPQGLIAGGPQMSSVIRFEAAVYLLPDKHENADAVPRELLAKKYSQFKVVDDLPAAPDSSLVSLQLKQNVAKDYAPPSIDSLHYSGYGLAPEQAQALQKSQRALIFKFAHPKQEVWRALHSSAKLLEDVARDTGGLVWDEETREVFTPDAWHAKRLASWPESASIPDVSSQTVVHVYQNGEFVRAITLGMRKLGLPDVIVDDFGWSTERQTGNLINVFGQAMAEGTPLDPAARFKLDLQSIKNSAVREPQLKSLKPFPSATGVAVLTLYQGHHDEGDPDNRLIRLGSDAYSGNDAHAKQETMFSCFFGTKDAIHPVRHDEQLLEASRKAREQLPTLRKAFRAGLQPGEFILVKAPFPLPDGSNEWMWVEVTNWHGNDIKGLLQNDPAEVRNLHAGQLVDVREADLFDFIHKFPDGHSEGNTTGEIIAKMEQVPTSDASATNAPPPDCTTN